MTCDGLYSNLGGRRLLRACAGAGREPAFFTLAVLGARGLRDVDAVAWDGKVNTGGDVRDASKIQGFPNNTEKHAF